MASFRARGLRAELLSSALSAAERAAVMSDLEAERPATQLLFVTPELLATSGFMRTLRASAGLRGGEGRLGVHSWAYVAAGVCMCTAYAHRALPAACCLQEGVWLPSKAWRAERQMPTRAASQPLLRPIRPPAWPPARHLRSGSTAAATC